MIVFLMAQVFMPPYAWLEYCATDPMARCELTRELTAQDLAYIHLSLKKMTAKSDPDAPWVAFPEDRVGNCVAFALSARAALLSLGVKREDINILAGIMPTEEGDKGHTILSVKVGPNEWIIDQNATGIYKLSAQPYEWRLQAKQDVNQVTWTGQ